jgi:hypothetical protein
MRRVPQWSGTTRLSRGTRPLRQNYIKPHCPQCPPVSRRLLLWQPPLRALWVKATGFMQNCLRWSGRTAVGASRSLARPTRRRLRALVVVVAPWHWSGAARCVVGQWPAASHVVCAPAHPRASPLRGISPARWSARPPPVGGSLSPRALVVGFSYSFCSWSRTDYWGYRSKRPVSQRARWLTFGSNVCDSCEAGQNKIVSSIAAGFGKSSYILPYIEHQIKKPATD